MIDNGFLAIEALAGRLIRAARLDSIARSLRRQKIPVLMYHSVVPDDSVGTSCLDQVGMTVSESRFRDHMRYVAHHYSTITLAEYVAWRRGHGSIREHPCILTFDDGFRDTYERAFPLLRKLGLRAVIFPIGCTLTKERPSHPHELYAILDSVPMDEAARELARLLPELPSEDYRTKETLRRSVVWGLAQRSREERSRILAALRTALATHRPQATRFMSGSELRELVDAGFEIGSHTLHHEYLTLLSDDELEREIARGAEVIEEATGRRPQSFCYPYGVSDGRTSRALRKSGFDCAVSMREGLIDSRTDLYALRRIRVTWDIPLPVLVFRVLGSRSLLWSLPEPLKKLARRWMH
jgi:peptidoglycan/xylan/chitin deacetylase (PgdA/CDA1 family)